MNKFYKILFLVALFFGFVSPAFAVAPWAVEPVSPVYFDVPNTPVCGTGETSYRVRDNENTLIYQGACGTSFIYPSSHSPSYTIPNSYMRGVGGGAIYTFTPETAPVPSGPSYSSPVVGGFGLSSSSEIITDTLQDYGLALLAVIGVFLSFGVAYLVFRFGWRKVKGSTGSVSESDRVFLDAQKHFGWKLNRKSYFRNTPYE